MASTTQSVSDAAVTLEASSEARLRKPTPEAVDSPMMAASTSAAAAVQLKNSRHQKQQKPPSASHKLKKDATVFSRVFRFLERNQVELPLAILIPLWLLHFAGVEFPRRFLFLSHAVSGQEGQTLYVKGPHDAAFVLHLILVVTFSRAFVLRLAFWFSRQIGVAKHAKQLRFAEQSWAFLYYSFQFLTGLSIAYNSEFWMDIKHLFIGYPHIQHTHQLKLYYLTCMSFWMQQFFVIHVEERRKDHWQMLLHHVVTTGLLLASYYTNFVRMGIAIQVMFDAADILLALAKLFRYAGFSKLTDMLFVGFVLVWLVTRHIMFGYLWYDAYNTVEKYIDYEWAPSEGKFFTERTKMFFHCMFAALMALVLFWFALILKLVVRVASGNNVDDNRSDSEDESAETSNKND